MFWIELLKDFFGKKAGEQLAMSEQDAQPLITAGIAKKCDHDPLNDALSKGFSDLMGKMTAGLDQAVNTALKSFAEAQTRSRKNRGGIIFGEGNNGDTKKTFGSFLLAIHKKDYKALEEMGSHRVDWQGVTQKADLGEQGGAYGGFTVPEQFVGDLLSLAAEQSIVESRATVIPMTSPVVKIPALDVTTAPTAGNTAFYGGLKAGWAEEAASLTEYEPTFKEITLNAYKLAGYSQASNELLADNAVGLEALLKQMFGGAIAWYKDYAFLRGTGVGQPRGILNSPALIQCSRSAASAFALADAATMLSRLLPGWNRKNTAWVMQPTVYAKALQMSESGTGSALMLAPAHTGEGPVTQLLGIPILVTEKLPALNTLGDVLLCDFRHYLIGNRGGIEIASSEHVAFTTDQMTWRFVTRCDGQGWLRTAVTLADASTTVSPFVGLAAGS